MMHYYRRYFTDETVKTMLGDFYTLLMGMIENPGQTVGELKSLIRSERKADPIRINDKRIQ